MSLFAGTLSQDPDERVRYGFDWSAQLASTDTVATSSWTYGGASSSGSGANTTTTTTTALVYGASGKEYTVENTVLTTGGETLQAHFVLRIC